MLCLFRLVPENGQVLCSGLYNGTCKSCSKDVTFWSVPSPVSEITFTVNGTQYTVTNPDPGMSLNEWLRDQPGLQGRLIVTSHAKTYTHGFPFSNGNPFTSRFSSVQTKFASVRTAWAIRLKRKSSRSNGCVIRSQKLPNRSNG